ncbi:LysR substrate-binding domain-containing protein [Bordetella bronchiseptica]
MRKLPPLHGLRAFEAAARHLHFTRAAAELHLTPTAISHQVRQLEDLLGVELFRRYPRPLRLTAAGEQLFPVLRDALDRIAASVQALAADASGEPLRLSVTMAFASRWLMQRLPLLREQTGLEVVVEADDKAVDLHASGIAMAIRYAEKPGAAAHWHRLFPDSFVPVCAPGLIEQKLPLSPKQILALPLLHYRWKSASAHAPDWERWHARARGRGPVPPPRQTFSEEIHALDAALAGQGAVLASQLLVRQALEQGALTLLSPVALPGPTYWAVFLPSHPDSKRLETLLEWFRQQA